MDDDPLKPLLEAATAGDAAALDELVSRYLPRLHAYVRLHMNAPLRAREASIDVVQSVCREVLEEREKFVYQGEGPLIGWMRSVERRSSAWKARSID